MEFQQINMQLSRTVLPMGTGGFEGQRDALTVHDQVALGARFAPLGRVGSVSSPPRLAGTLLLSRQARLHSSCPSRPPSHSAS